MCDYRRADCRAASVTPTERAILWALFALALVFGALGWVDLLAHPLRYHP